MSFSEITMIEIGKVTSIIRPSIYNYFKTKEEIFLALLQKECELWIEELEKIISENKNLSKKEFADLLAKSLENREQFLKLMTMNHYDMEVNSRRENLIEFKKVYGKSLQTVENCLEKFFPNFTDEDKDKFLYSFFPFVYGIYPYTVISEEQKTVMREAGVKFKYHSVYELAYEGILKLLS